MTFAHLWKPPIYSQKHIHDLCCSIDTVPFTLRDIQQYKAKYVGSNTERADIKAAYLKHKGCLIHMSADILFMDKYSEPRSRRL
uniref:DNAJC9 HTH domain-containing protein n=1 Tax=Megaselia scalaris TaxID=36166 RepID=T1H2R7_MEGSC